MDNLRELIVAYYNKVPNTTESMRASLDIDRNVQNLIRQGETEDNIITFLNRTQDEILAGLPVDDPKRMQRRYEQRKIIANRQKPTPVRPLVADKSREEEVAQLLNEANIGFNMISGLIRNNNDINSARIIFGEIVNIPTNPSLIGFDEVRNQIELHIRNSGKIIQDAEERAQPIGARGLAARAAPREAARAAPRAAPRAPVVSPDSLPTDIIAESLDSKTLEQYKEMMECPICYQNIRNIRIVPCGHTICKSCAENIISHQGDNKRCPICNASRKGFNKAFYAKYLKYKIKYLQLKKEN